ncbi:MAG: pilus motility taxis protein HmpF, partial [Spirulinaceae cyanobacterium]
REEFERKSQELEQAWAHLRGEQERLNEQQQAVAEAAPAAAGASVDPQQAQRLQELIDYLNSTPLPTADLATQMQGLQERFAAQQSNLSHYSQQLEEQRADAEQQQAMVATQEETWETQHQELQNTRVALDQAKQQVHEAQLALQLHNTQVEILEQGLARTTTLLADLSALSAGEQPASEEDSGVDVTALEQMPLEELQGMVDELQTEYDRNARFIADQEEELKLQREAVTEIEDKLKSATVYDAPALEQELADEQEQRKLLDQTLMGQRRTLLEKQAVLKQHLRVLHRRQGIAEPDATEGADLTPVIQALEQQQTEQQAVLTQFEADLPDRQAALQTAESALQERLSDYDHQQSELKTLESSLNEARSATALLWGRVNLYEDLLEQLQGQAQETQQQMESLAAVVEQTQQTSDYQQEALTGLSDTVTAMLAEA